MLYILITIIFFSTIEVVAKLIGSNIDPLFLAFLRFFLSGIILLAIEYKKLKAIKIRDLKEFTILAIIGVGLGIGSFHYGLNYLSASVAAVIFSLNPIFSALWASFYLGEKFTKEMKIGSILALIGTYIISFGFTLVSLNSIKGPLLLLISSISFGIYISKSKSVVKKHGSIFTTGIVFLIGSFTYLPFITSYKIHNLVYSLPLIAHIVFGATALAYVFYFKGLQDVSIIVGSSMFYLKPIFATILAMVILGEVPKFNFYIGLLIVAIGLLLINLRRDREKDKKRELTPQS